MINALHTIDIRTLYEWQALLSLSAEVQSSNRLTISLQNSHEKTQINLLHFILLYLTQKHHYVSNPQEPYEFIFHLLLHKEHKLPSSNMSFVLCILDLTTSSLAICRSTTKINAGDVLHSHALNTAKLKGSCGTSVRAV